MLIFYLFKTKRKVRKIIQHTDSGVEGEEKGSVTKEGMLTVLWPELLQLAPALT